MKAMNVVRTYGSKFGRQLAVGATLLVPVVAFAQGGGIDVSGSVAEIGQAKTAALLIGAAVLSVAIGIMLYKWVRRAL